MQRFKVSKMSQTEAFTPLGAGLIMEETFLRLRHYA